MTPERRRELLEHTALGRHAIARDPVTFGWDEDKHPRGEKGSDSGGRFVSKDGGSDGKSDSGSSDIGKSRPMDPSDAAWLGGPAKPDKSKAADPDSDEARAARGEGSRLQVEGVRGNREGADGASLLEEKADTLAAKLHHWAETIYEATSPLTEDDAFGLQDGARTTYRFRAEVAKDMADRYGKTGAHLIFASAAALATTVPYPLSLIMKNTSDEMPLDIPLAALPATVLAETALQFGRGVKAVGGGLSKAATVLKSAYDAIAKRFPKLSLPSAKTPKAGEGDDGAKFTANEAVPPPDVVKAEAQKVFEKLAWGLVNSIAARNPEFALKLKKAKAEQGDEPK